MWHRMTPCVILWLGYKLECKRWCNYVLHLSIVSIIKISSANTYLLQDFLAPISSKLWKQKLFQEISTVINKFITILNFLILVHIFSSPLPPKLTNFYLKCSFHHTFFYPSFLTYLPFLNEKLAQHAKCLRFCAHLIFAIIWPM